MSENNACTIVDDILGRREGESSHNAARRVVAERDQLRRDLESLQDSDPYSERNQAASAWMAISTHPLIGDLPSLPERGTYAESVRARLDEIAANPSLPEPDATNPDHLRFCADILDPMDGAVDSIYLRARADRLDAARSAEREREQRIVSVADAMKASFPDAKNGWWDWAVVAVDALDAAGLLRGGGRGE